MTVKRHIWAEKMVKFAEMCKKGKQIWIICKVEWVGEVETKKSRDAAAQNFLIKVAVISRHHTLHLYHPTVLICVTWVMLGRIRKVC